MLLFESRKMSDVAWDLAPTQETRYVVHAILCVFQW